jgi:hypothetical protein
MSGEARVRIAAGRPEADGGTAIRHQSVRTVACRSAIGLMDRTRTALRRCEPRLDGCAISSPTKAAREPMTVSGGLAFRKSNRKFRKASSGSSEHCLRNCETMHCGECARHVMAPWIDHRVDRNEQHCLFAP